MYVYIYICIYIYIYIHIYGDVCTTQICTYIHINMFFDMFVYMHAACVYVMSVCALFLQGKRRPQEMLWSCTAWSTNFLNLGYKPRYLIYIILYINDYKRIWFEFEFHYLLLYIYIYTYMRVRVSHPKRVLRNCWTIVGVFLVAWRYTAIFCHQRVPWKRSWFKKGRPKIQKSSHCKSNSVRVAMLALSQKADLFGEIVTSASGREPRLVSEG